MFFSSIMHQALWIDIMHKWEKETLAFVPLLSEMVQECKSSSMQDCGKNVWLWVQIFSGPLIWYISKFSRAPLNHQPSDWKQKSFQSEFQRKSQLQVDEIMKKNISKAFHAYLPSSRYIYKSNKLLPFRPITSNFVDIQRERAHNRDDTIKYSKRKSVD